MGERDDRKLDELGALSGCIVAELDGVMRALRVAFWCGLTVAALELVDIIVRHGVR